MKEKQKDNPTRFMQLGFAVFLGLMFLALILVGGLQQAVPAAADTVPTPVYVSGSDDALNVTYFAASTNASSVNSTAKQLVRYEYQDVQWVIDQDDTVNTATLTIQWSNDNSNWSDGPALVSANTTDADGMVQVANLGRYTRLALTLTGTDTLTVTVKAVAK